MYLMDTIIVFAFFFVLCFTGELVYSKKIGTIKAEKYVGEVAKRARLAKQRGESQSVVYHGVVYSYVNDDEDVSGLDLFDDEGITIVEDSTSYSWALDMLDNGILDESNLTFPVNGAGVDVYVVDTGINSGHTVFSGRVHASYDAITDTNRAGDCHGHGTHVASLIGGNRTGLATGVTFFSVKILGCSGHGTTIDFLKGMNFIENMMRDRYSKRVIVNMSLQSPKNELLDRAVSNLHEMGAVVVIAAGNMGGNACDFSPSGSKSGIIVGALEKTGEIASFSNRGECLTTLAPGVQIFGAGPANNRDYVLKSGTSMSTALVSGIIALKIQLNSSSTFDELMESVRVENGTVSMFAQIPQCQGDCVDVKKPSAPTDRPIPVESVGVKKRYEIGDKLFKHWFKTTACFNINYTPREGEVFFVGFSHKTGKRIVSEVDAVYRLGSRKSHNVVFNNTGDFYINGKFRDKKQGYFSVTSSRSSQVLLDKQC